MAVHNQTIADVDLGSGTIMRTFANRMIGEGDTQYNRFGVRCFRNRERLSLAGCTVSGLFVKPDGNTVAIEGSTYCQISNDEAWVTLPETCYAVTGQFTLSIQLTGGSVTGTVCIIDGTVIETTTGAIIDPGNIITELEDMDDAVAAIEAAAATIDDYTVKAEIESGDNYTIVVTGHTS